MVHSNDSSNYTIHNSLSDHNAVITCIIEVKSHRVYELRCLKRTNFDKAKEQLTNSIDNENILNIDDPDIIADRLIALTQEALTQNTISIQVKVKAKNINCPWFNWKVMNAIKRKESLSRRAKRSKKSKNKLRRMLKFDSLKLKRIIEDEKKKYKLRLHHRHFLVLRTHVCINFRRTLNLKRMQGNFFLLLQVVAMPFILLSNYAE